MITPVELSDVGHEKSTQGDGSDSEAAHCGPTKGQLSWSEQRLGHIHTVFLSCLLTLLPLDSHGNVSLIKLFTTGPRDLL